MDDIGRVYQRVGDMAANAAAAQRAYESGGDPLLAAGFAAQVEILAAVQALIEEEYGPPSLTPPPAGR